jgi:hypothetical protein
MLLAHSTLIIQGHAVLNSIYRVLIEIVGITWYYNSPTTTFSPSSSTLNLSADVLLCDHRPGLSRVVSVLLSHGRAQRDI